MRPPAFHHLRERAVIVDRKDQNRNAVLAGKGNRRRIHHLQVTSEYVHIGQCVKTCRVGMFHRIGVIDAIDLGRLEQASQPISEARKAAAVSVVKYGLPVPAAKIHGFSMWRMARRRI